MQRLEATGGTLRHRGGARCALVVGDTITSHFWLNILPLAADSSMRYYITEDDLQVLAHRLHVCPTVVPAFLVFCDQGYPIDWFPAPLPARGQAAQHGDLIQAVRNRLRQYR